MNGIADLSITEILVVILVILFFLNLIFKKEWIESLKSLISALISNPLVTIFLAMSSTVFTVIYVVPKIENIFNNGKNDTGSGQVLPVDKFFYDTDYKNDLYIKGDLSESQLLLFDIILEHEKMMDCVMLSESDLGILCKDDRALKDAYYRWRECAALMRSTTRTIYPSDRHLIHYYH